MSSISRESVGSAGRVALAVALACVSLTEAVPAAAGVKSATQINAYRVGGSTAASVVSYMRNNPFPGDHGDAVANIRPSYSLSIATKQSGGICRASSVNLNVRFVMTLPTATGSGAMSGGTRAAWNGFVAFARRHEEHHKAIYLQCANAFVAKAERLTSSSCFALNGNIRGLLEAAKRACENKQLAFDHQDAHRVFGLSLFAMAKYNGRKPRGGGHIAAGPRVIPVSASGSGLTGPR